VSEEPVVVFWKKDGENCSGEGRLRPALYLNRAAVFVDDFRAEPKSEAGRGFSFAGDKWLE
jgi:hypothetical protein